MSSPFSPSICNMCGDSGSPCSCFRLHASPGRLKRKQTNVIRLRTPLPLSLDASRRGSSVLQERRMQQRLPHKRHVPAYDARAPGAAYRHSIQGLCLRRHRQAPALCGVGPLASEQARRPGPAPSPPRTPLLLSSPPIKTPPFPSVLASSLPPSPQLFVAFSAATQRPSCRNPRRASSRCSGAP